MSELIIKPKSDDMGKNIFYILLFLLSLSTIQMLYGTLSQIIIHNFKLQGNNYIIENYWSMTIYFILAKVLVISVYSILLFLTLKQVNWKFSSIGFDVDNLTEDIKLGFKTFLVFPVLPFVVYFLFSNIIGTFNVEKFLKPSIDLSLQQSFLSFFLILLTSVLIFPIFEEILFRGVLFKKLLYISRPLTAILISSLIFSLFHIDLFKLDSFYLPNLMPIFIGGIALGFLRWKTGNLWSSILFHILWNGFTYSTYYWSIIR